MKNPFKRNLGPKSTVTRHKYCPVCGGQREARDNVFRLAARGLLTVFVGIIMLLGASFAFMILVNPFYVVLPLVASANFKYTEMASEHHPEVQEIADDITKRCESLQAHSDLYFGCLVKFSISHITSNFEYENDWEMGRANGVVTENLILSDRKKGDCIDFSVTFCSLMKHMGISCIVRSPNGGHRIAVVRWDDAWIPIEPQTGKSGYFDDDNFEGFLI